MKTILLIFSLVVTSIAVSAEPGMSVPDAAAPQRYAQYVLDSDHATIAVFDAERKPRTVTIRDRDWLQQFSKMLSSAVYQPRSHILAIGRPIIFYGKDGRKILEIQIFETAVRFNSQDYEIGKNACEAIAGFVTKGKD